MSLIQEKFEIVNNSRTFNAALKNVFDARIIDYKLPSSKILLVDLSIRSLLREHSYNLLKYTAYEQIVIELSNSKSILDDIILQNGNRKLNTYTRKAIEQGSNYASSELDRLKFDFEEKARNTKQKNKGKFEDIIVSEKEFALFIILAEKYGLISKMISASDTAFIFSELTNISNQTLRENIGSKYQVNPKQLLLNKDNLENLKQTILNICDEIEVMKKSLTG